jgi:hypothetical protein
MGRSVLRRSIELGVVAVALIALVWLTPERFRFLMLAIGGVLVLLAAAVLVVPPWLLARDVGAAVPPDQRANAINSVRSTMVQGIVGLAALGGIFVAWQQLQTDRDLTREGQVTDRYTGAIDQLGHKNVDVRLGGIYALARIAKDSPPDRVTVAEVLTAFIRGHAPWPPRLPGQPPADTFPPDKLPLLQSRAPDVQAALTVLSRDRRSDDQPLDLNGTDLRRAQLVGAHLERTDFSGAHMEGAQLDDAHLERAILVGANLTLAHLSHAHLERAILVGANLKAVEFYGAHLGAFLSGANLEWAGLASTNLEGADLSDTRLKEALLTGANLEKARLDKARLKGAWADETTRWPAGFDWRRAGVRQVR